MFQVLACARHYNQFNLTSIHLIINYLEILISFKFLIIIIYYLQLFFFNRKLNFILKIVTMFSLGQKWGIL